MSNRVAGYSVVQIAPKQKSCRYILKSTSRSLYADLNWAIERYLNKCLSLKWLFFRSFKQGSITDYYFSVWWSFSLRVHNIKTRNIRLLFRISASHIDHRSFVDRCHNNIFISFFSGLKVKESGHWRLAKFKLLILSWYLDPCMAIWRQGFLLSLLTGRGKYLPPSCLQSEKQHCDCLKRSLSSCFMSSLQTLLHLFYSGNENTTDITYPIIADQ